MTEANPLDQDRTLMAAVADGDQEAFRLVYEHTYGKVARYLGGFVKDETLAEEVVIQTYATVWKNSGGYRGDSRLVTWIIGIARNLAFKEFRKRKPETPFDEAYCGADTKSSTRPEDRDRNEKMRQAIAALPPLQKEIIELAFYQDLAYAEISELLGIPVNTVKTRVFHAKKALLEELAHRKLSYHDLC